MNSLKLNGDLKSKTNQLKLEQVNFFEQIEGLKSQIERLNAKNLNLNNQIELEKNKNLEQVNFRV